MSPVRFLWNIDGILITVTKGTNIYNIGATRWSDSFLMQPKQTASARDAQRQGILQKFAHMTIMLSFVNECITTIVRIRWSTIICIGAFWLRTEEEPNDFHVKKMKRSLIGHIIGIGISNHDSNSYDSHPLAPFWWNRKGKAAKRLKRRRISIGREHTVEGRSILCALEMSSLCAMLHDVLCEVYVQTTIR